MGSKIYANGQNIACKSADGKSVCAFPDVCFTPPQTPATPPGVPIPYPSTGLASDTTDGSKTVKIGSKEVMLKNKSYLKKSSGDEAGSAPKKGVVTSKITGKVYFNSWSMDVKFEGENVVRNLDLTTHNHASMPGNTPTWPYLDDAAMGSGGDVCAKDRKKEQDDCGSLNKNDACNNEACQTARKCMLVPRKKGKCCPGQTPHHLVEVHGFTMPGNRQQPMPQFPDYKESNAPCVCAKCPKGSRYYQEHGDLHAVQGVLELGAIGRASPNMKHMSWNYGQARSAGLKAHAATFPQADCDPGCIKKQIDNYHQQEGLSISDDTPIRTEAPPLLNEPSQWQRGLALLDQLAKKTKPGGF